MEHGSPLKYLYPEPCTTCKSLRHQHKALLGIRQDIVKWISELYEVMHIPPHCCCRTLTPNPLLGQTQAYLCLDATQ